jgi:hypothetical protein
MLVTLMPDVALGQVLDLGVFGPFFQACRWTSSGAALASHYRVGATMPGSIIDTLIVAHRLRLHTNAACPVACPTILFGSSGMNRNLFNQLATCVFATVVGLAFFRAYRDPERDDTGTQSVRGRNDRSWHYGSANMAADY